MSYVYLMVGDDAFKVGKSNDPDDRLKVVHDRLGENARVHMVVQCRSERRAFDVEKSIHRILKPHRIVDEGLGRECYRHSGLEAAESILSAIEDEPPEPKKKRRSGLRMVTAFGDTKSVSEWARDSRCEVHVNTLRDRLRRGVPPEEAISGPSKAGHNHSIEVTAFGETKSVPEWASDPRTSLTRAGIYQRLYAGKSGEDALIGSTRPCRALTVNGETKSLSEWSTDPRCTVSPNSIAARLDRGWPPSRAVFDPPTRPQRVISAFGETKNVSGWVRDPRCKVGRDQLQRLLRNGLSPEAAMRGTSYTRRHRRISAFGETKSIPDWAADGRCPISLRTLRNRLSSGWPPEKAINTPPRGSK